MKTAKIFAKRLEWVTESGELFGTELDTHRKARSRPCVTVSAWQKNNSSKITVILAPSAVQLQLLFWRPEISCAWPAFCTERVGSQLLKTQSERMSCPCFFFGHLRKCRSRMQRKWITATTGLMVVRRATNFIILSVVGWWSSWRSFNHVRWFVRFELTYRFLILRWALEENDHDDGDGVADGIVDDDVLF